MGIFGSDSRVTANTTNTTTSETNVGGSIGLTGGDFVQSIGTITGGLYAGLDRLFQTSQGAIGGAYDLTSRTIEQNTVYSDRIASRAEDTLANLTNATRDFVQRAIAGSTGQATPLQHLAGASNMTSPLQTSGQSNMILILGVAAIAAYVFLRK